jgi:hypothetical protein
MPDHSQSHEPLDGLEPREFREYNEEYGTADRQYGGYWYRRGGTGGEGFDDEDVSFGGYDPDRPQAGRISKDTGGTTHQH